MHPLKDRGFVSRSTARYCMTDLPEIWHLSRSYDGIERSLDEGGFCNSLCAFAAGRKMVFGIEGIVTNTSRGRGAGSQLMKRDRHRDQENGKGYGDTTGAE